MRRKRVICKHAKRGLNMIAVKEFYFPYPDNSRNEHVWCVFRSCIAQSCSDVLLKTQLSLPPLQMFKKECPELVSFASHVGYGCTDIFAISAAFLYHLVK